MPSPKEPGTRAIPERRHPPRANVVRALPARRGGAARISILLADGSTVESEVDLQAAITLCQELWRHLLEWMARETRGRA